MEDMNEILNQMTPEERSICLEAQMNLDNLLVKERIDDAEYEKDIARFRDAGDLEGLEEYKKHNVSKSEFEKEQKGLTDIIYDLLEKYGYSRENLKNDIKERANISREKLIAIKKGYDALGHDTIWRDLTIETINSLTDEEVIARYREFRQRVPFEKEAEIIEAGKKAEERLNYKAKIERALEDFRKESKEISKQFADTQFNLILGAAIGAEVTEAIKELDEEVRKLNEEAKELIAEMDAFRLQSYEDDFSMSVHDVLATVKGFKTRLTELKQNQIDKYNVRVDATNRKIAELKAMEGLSPEIIEKINQLPELSNCNVRIGTWTDFNKYLSQIDYNKLVEVNKLISEIEKELENGKEKNEVEKLEEELNDELVWIEDKISELDGKIKDDMSKEEVEAIRQEIINISNRVNEFNAKLINNKDNIRPFVFDDYFDRARDAEINLYDLNAKLRITKTDDNVFEEMKKKLNTLDTEIDSIAEMAEVSFGQVTQNVVDWYLNKVDTIEARLNDVKNEIEEAKKNGQLDENQYAQLNKMVQDIENKLVNSRTKLRDPGMVIGGDVFGLLNGRIDGVEAAIDALEQQIDGLEKPIKDKNTRKAIDAQFKKIEEEIKDIEKYLEENKDKEPDKYNAAKERLDNAKDRLDKIGKKYRSKCPFLVRVVKSAKDFYKKHKKAILIAAGLAAFALLSYHVIIPAIMYGNILMGATSPALSGVVTFMNNILGPVSAATHIGNNVWTLGGTVINPAIGTSSLLKGLAISGIGSTALIAPLVIAIKKLNEKGKQVEQKITLREKMKKAYGDMRDKVKGKMPKKKEKDPKEPKKVNPKKADKHALEELYELYATLFKSYRKSGLTLEEFCEQEKLSERDKEILQVLVDKSNEKIEESKKGRKGGK